MMLSHSSYRRIVVRLNHLDALRKGKDGLTVPTVVRQTPRIMPDERYFSMPSAELGSEMRRNFALNCWPWVSLSETNPAATEAESRNASAL